MTAFIVLTVVNGSSLTENENVSYYSTAKFLNCEFNISERSVSVSTNAATYKQFLYQLHDN